MILTSHFILTSVDRAVETRVLLITDDLLSSNQTAVINNSRMTFDYDFFFFSSIKLTDDEPQSVRCYVTFSRKYTGIRKRDGTSVLCTETHEYQGHVGIIINNNNTFRVL